MDVQYQEAKESVKKKKKKKEKKKLSDIYLKCRSTEPMISTSCFTDKSDE